MLFEIQYSADNSSYHDFMQVTDSYMRLSNDNGITWHVLQWATPGTPTYHNSLAGLQGGTTGEYYHLTLDQLNATTQQADATHNGFLASTDWNTFNNKTNFPGFGTTGTTACVGNDARLSDARPASDVYAWAKAATKPAYTYIEVGADAAGAAAAITLSGLGGVPTARTVNGHALTADVTVTKSDLSLGSVENTALSTWSGSTNLTTLGTIATGVWHGSAIADSYISSASTWNGKQNAYTNLTTFGTLANAIGWLYDNGSGAFAYSTPTKSDVGLGSVENTALSTWAGSTNLTTLGTIATGVWHGSAIADSYISSAATWNAKQAAISFGTGVLTALGVNVGSAGAPVLFNGALGTPTSGSAANLTSFPTLNQNTSGTAAGLSATLAVTSGGTGLATIASGKMLYASASNMLAELSLGNSVSITGGVLDTIQDIRTTATPQFTRLGVGQVASATVALAVTGVSTSAGTCASINGNLVIGASAISNPAGFNRMLQIQGSNAVFSFRDPTGTPQQYDFGVADPAGIGNKDYGIYNATAGLWLMVLQQSTGNVGIGVINPTQKLHIDGAIKTNNPSGGTAQPWKFGNYTAGVAVQAGKVRVEINGTPYDLLTA